MRTAAPAKSAATIFSENANKTSASKQFEFNNVCLKAAWNQQCMPQISLISPVSPFEYYVSVQPLIFSSDGPTLFPPSPIASFNKLKSWMKAQISISWESIKCRIQWFKSDTNLFINAWSRKLLNDSNSVSTCYTAQLLSVAELSRSL